MEYAARGTGSALDLRSYQGVRQSKLCYPLRIPPLVKERILVRFTKGPLKVENKEHLFDLVVTLNLNHFAAMFYSVAECHSQL